MYTDNYNIRNVNLQSDNTLKHSELQLLLFEIQISADNTVLSNSYIQNLSWNAKTGMFYQS